MTDTWMDLAADSGAMSAGLVIAAVVVVALLIGAFALGSRVRRRELPPPTVDEQPRLPPDGAVHEIREHREAEEMPHDGDRTLPHELRHQGTRSAPEEHRRKWSEGGSGSFGSGGPGVR
ncbi:DUF6479 family protein [Streptomyces sp. NPDC052077]|uniref:DUF6479 family protein n=1 Tax=Streptomyces sp. NPDC052077 TaxID=3154757 RepID=UPI00341E0276